jgi:hypothetical protein
LWVLPTAGAALLGVALRQNVVMEIGPTGPLAGETEAASAMSGWMGILAVAVVALLAIVVIDRSGLAERITRSIVVAPDAGAFQ